MQNVSRSVNDEGDEPHIRLFMVNGRESQVLRSYCSGRCVVELIGHKGSHFKNATQ